MYTPSPPNLHTHTHTHRAYFETTLGMTEPSLRPSLRLDTFVKTYISQIPISLTPTGGTIIFLP